MLLDNTSTSKAHLAAVIILSDLLHGTVLLPDVVLENHSIIYNLRNLASLTLLDYTVALSYAYIFPFFPHMIAL